MYYLLFKRHLFSLKRCSFKNSFQGVSRSFYRVLLYVAEQWLFSYWLNNLFSCVLRGLKQMLWVPHPNLFSHEYHFSAHQLTSQLPAPKSLGRGFPVATRARSTYTHVLGTDSPCLCGNRLQWMTDSRWLSINDAERTLVPLHPRWNITRCIFFSCSHNSPAGWCSKMLTCLIRTRIGFLQFCLNSLFPYWCFPRISSQINCLHANTCLSVNFWGNSN